MWVQYKEILPIICSYSISLLEQGLSLCQKTASCSLSVFNQAILSLFARLMGTHPGSRKCITAKHVDSVHGCWQFQCPLTCCHYITLGQTQPNKYWFESI